MAAAHDDITRKSLSGPLLVAAVLVCAGLGWAVYDEVIGQRPWKGYQKQFRVAFTAHLQDLRPAAATAGLALAETRELRELDRQISEAERVAAPTLRQIRVALNATRTRREPMTRPLQDARARLAALVYELDHATDSAARLALQQRIAHIRQAQIVVNAEPYALEGLERAFNALQAAEARLTIEESAAGRTAADLRRRKQEYLMDRAGPAGLQQIDAALRRMETFPIAIRQIHVPESELVDRCESCHLGTRESLAWAAGDAAGPRAFSRHPKPALLALHDPDRFGCSPCHNGNGSATSSAGKAHGLNEGWPWPLFGAKHREAGCLQCHRRDRVLDEAPVLTRGRDVYELRGCAACHRYEGYDREVDGLADTRDQIRAASRESARVRLEIPLAIARGDAAAGNDEARQHYAHATSLRLTAANLDARVAELRDQAASLEQGRKLFGPRLKDVRLKLRKAWIPVWLNDPQGFRPGTNMPRFRLSEAERRAVAAFVWRAGVDTPGIPPEPAGNAVRGKESFETRGCLGCHSIGEGQARIGDTFAPNLSRLGEKADYSFVVRWIHDPRERTTTMVMPNFQLSWDESRDIATYLTGLRRTGAAYPADVSYMDIGYLADTGRTLVSRYGCANCHEIRGFENAPRVGTELTREGSKPIEQLDFGLLARNSRREGWYTPTGFFEHKLSEPAVYDRGREKAPADRLRMPDIALTTAEVDALTTMLAGSVDAPTQGSVRTIAPNLRYEPKGLAKDVQDGWWLVKRFNCLGCHAIQPGQASSLSVLPRYQDPDWKEKLPPALHQEGARVNPEWLGRFLANPQLNDQEPGRNGVRPYLQVRMPTFSFSPDQIRTLVRFFAALSSQVAPYVAPRPEPLTTAELAMARALFSSRESVCVKCHVVGDPRRDRTATAPDLLLVAGRLKPEWTARWMVEPQQLSPGTAMPDKLFRRLDGRWVFAGRMPDAFRGYTKDHAQLLVRYMFQLTADEQQRLIRALPASASVPPTGGRLP